MNFSPKKTRGRDRIIKIAGRTNFCLKNRMNLLKSWPQAEASPNDIVMLPSTSVVTTGSLVYPASMHEIFQVVTKGIGVFSDLMFVLREIDLTLIVLVSTVS